MKIGIMLRHYEQLEGGVKVYTKQVLPLLFKFGAKHRFVLIYQNPKLLGTYSDYENVEECAVKIPGTVLWDQVAVPWIARKKHLDLIFNPKFTIPFLAKAKKVFVLHGAAWFVLPEHFKRFDQWYFKRFVPLYCRHADAFVSVAHSVKEDVVRLLGVDPAKVYPIHNGFNPELFRPVRDPLALQSVKTKYKLPDKFILWAGQIESRKNVARLLEAFALIKDKVPHYLVMAGEQRWNASTELRNIDALGIKARVLFTGWVTHSDLPTVYCLADLFAFPSLYEGFGIPLLEAMGCGCPIVTANTATPPEVTNGAACLVNPLDSRDIADGMYKVIQDRTLRDTMIAKGLERAQDFSWEKCAKQLLAVFESRHS